MVEMMNESSGNVVGFKAAGVIEPADYEYLVPKFEELIRQHGSMRVLMDMHEFKSEAPAAWWADIKFGHEFHNKIEKIAIVGDKRWEKWMTAFCAPFYTREAKYFRTDEMATAWSWLRE